MSEYFPESTSSEGTDYLDLANFATKADLKNAIIVDTLNLLKRLISQA